MLNRIAYAGGVLLLLAACTESPTAPPLADNDLLAFSVQGGQDKVQVCHVDGKGSVRAIEVAAPALAAHLRHGDFEPGTGEAGPIDIPAVATFSAHLPPPPFPDFPPPTFDPADAFDGDLTTLWAAVGYGTDERSIEIDFGSPQSFSSISAMVHQEPIVVDPFAEPLQYLPVATKSVVVLMDGDDVIVNSFTWSVTTADGDVLTHAFLTPQTATTVRITTTVTTALENPIGTGWYEIQFLAEGGAVGCTP
jgi:hypothetical protein